MTISATMIPPYIAQAIQCLRSVVSMACGQASGIRYAEVRAKSSSGIPAAFSKKARPNSTQRAAKTALRIRPPRMYLTCWSTAMASASWMGTDWLPTDHQLRSASAMGVNRNSPSGISGAVRVAAQRAQRAEQREPGERLEQHERARPQAPVVAARVYRSPGQREHPGHQVAEVVLE